MGADVHILVTCANRKTVPPAPALTARTVPSGSVRARAAEWTSRVRRADGTAVPAETLYAGDHWHVARSLLALAEEKNLTVRLWVCSAGYGLFPADSRIRSYAATFAPNLEDSVCLGETAAADSAAWWASLARWPGPAPGTPRSVASIANEHPNSGILIAASPSYLAAMCEDITAAASGLRSADQLAIFSAGGTDCSALAPHLVPCSARLQPRLGGALGSLNVRCLRHALANPEGGLGVSALRGRFERLIRRQPVQERVARRPLDDDQVRAFIRKELSSAPAARPTALLRKLRASGRACEHSRFVSLFRSVEGGER